MLNRASQNHMSGPFYRRVLAAHTTVKFIGYLSITGGVFSFVFTLLMATHLSGDILNLSYLSLVAGGAVAFAIGIGLLNCAESARQAGSGWYLALGILNLLIACKTIMHGDARIGVLCLITAAVQIACAGILHLPAEAFVCRYIGAEVTPQGVQEGLLRARDDTSKAIVRFIAHAQKPPMENARGA